MQISKQKVNTTLEKQISKMLFQLVADIRTPEEAGRVMEDLFSETELVTITKRLAVGYWLKKKRSYENIKQNLKVSSATIASVQQSLKQNGWKTALQRIEAEEWATKWEQKIKGVLGKK